MGVGQQQFLKLLTLRTTNVEESVNSRVLLQRMEVRVWVPGAPGSSRSERSKTVACKDFLVAVPSVLRFRSLS